MNYDFSQNTEAEKKQIKNSCLQNIKKLLLMLRKKPNNNEFIKSNIQQNINKLKALKGNDTK
jgi:hypothetical protein